MTERAGQPLTDCPTRRASYFFLPPLLLFVPSVTVVFGCDFAVDFLTNRPVMAERLLVPMAFTSSESGEG